MPEHPDLQDILADDRMSGVPRYRHRYSELERHLAQLAQRERDTRKRGEQVLAILSDLDRCVHGRHQGDVCGGCGTTSLGNPFLTVGQRIGTTMSARGIHWAGVDRYGDPTAWKR